jgi:HSP20 family molecular chaperone IbpA
MITAMQNTNNSSIYPGAFAPRQNEEEIRLEFSHVKERNIVHPPVSLVESGQFFQIEIPIPGLSSEEFLIEAENNVLSVYAVHKGDVTYETESFLLQILKSNCFEQHIFLPDNADVEFIQAVYSAGVLKMYISKTNHSVKNNYTLIAVY